MVLQVLADAGQVDDDVDAVLAKMRRRADAGEHQELRRDVGAGGEDDLGVARMGAMLGAVMQVADADGAAVLDDRCR